MEMPAKQDLVIFLVPLGLQKGKREGRNKLVIDFLVSVYLLPKEKPAKQEIVIFLAFLVA